MKKVIFIFSPLLIMFLVSSCSFKKENGDVAVVSGSPYPHIAGYVRNGQDLLKNQDVKYDLIYSSEIKSEEANEIKKRNPGAIILYQGPLNYMFDSALPVIEATTGKKITESFWLKGNNGQRCGFGWTPEMWAIDIRSSENIEIITSFYSNVLKYQPQYEGLFFDIIEERSRCNSVNDAEWVRQTASLLKSVRDKVGDKIILANAGWNYQEKTPYLEYINGYSMESFLSGAAGYDEGLKTVQLVLEKTREPHYLIYTVYNENTVTKAPINANNRRLAMTLSLLHNNTYLSYDQKMENIGAILWPEEHGVELGQARGDYYQKDNGFWREFEQGTVVSSPNSAVTVSFDQEHIDVTTGLKAKSFTIEKGDGRIFLSLSPK